MAAAGRFLGTHAPSLLLFLLARHSLCDSPCTTSVSVATLRPHITPSTAHLQYLRSLHSPKPFPLSPSQHVVAMHHILCPLRPYSNVGVPLLSHQPCSQTTIVCEPSYTFTGPLLRLRLRGRTHFTKAPSRQPPSLTTSQHDVVMRRTSFSALRTRRSRRGRR